MSDATEKPILFGDAMVRAILDGRKTQTRRIVKPPRRKIAIWDSPDSWVVDPGGTSIFGPGPYVHMAWWHRGDIGEQATAAWARENRPDDRLRDRVRCPYGYPEYGDRLWVREAHMLECQVDAAAIGNTPPFDDGRPIQHDPEWGWTQHHYRATDPKPELVDPAVYEDRLLSWRPSIHMPRWACRLVLRITKVRVERLQDITYGDVLAEGVTGSHSEAWDNFWHIWDEYNGKRAPWASNPWVWAIDFEVDVDG